MLIRPSVIIIFAMYTRVLNYYVVHLYLMVCMSIYTNLKGELTILIMTKVIAKRNILEKMTLHNTIVILLHMI